MTFISYKNDVGHLAIYHFLRYFALKLINNYI
jgi:hypothetical protein